jgi:hypothetical protein
VCTAAGDNGCECDPHTASVGTDDAVACEATGDMGRAFDSHTASAGAAAAAACDL